MARSKTPSPKVLTLLDDVEKCEKELVEAILSLPPRRPVQIVINSGGGSVYASLGVMAAMRLRELAAEAIVLADCSSSALLIFATCQRRRIAPHASFLFHPMRWSSEEQARLTGAKSWSAEFERVCAIYEEYLVEQLPIARRTLRHWMRQERYVPADELIAHGIASLLPLGDEKVIPISRARPRRGAQRSAAAIRRIG